MTTHLRAVELELADPDTQTDGRTISVRVVSWDTDYQVSDNGRDFYTERFIPGGLNMRSGAELVATSEHDPRMLHQGVAGRDGFDGRVGVPVGRIAATHVRADGLYADVRVFDSIDGAAFLRYVRSLARSGRDLFVSSEFDDIAHDDTGVVERVDATLIGLAFTLTPQHGDARVLAVRSQLETHMSDVEPDIDPEEEEETGTDVPEEDSDDMSDEDSGEPVPAATRSRPVPTRNTPRPGGTTAQRFRSFGHYARAVAAGELGSYEERTRSRHARTLDVATTAEATGLLPEAWARDVIDLYRLYTPTINAWRSKPLPPSGLVVNQPVVSVRPEVAAQAAENDEVASTMAEIVPATWTVGTYAGGQETTMQTILRTDPQYLDEMMRLYTVQAAQAVNRASALALLAAADSVNTTDLEYTTAAAFDALIVSASATFYAALNRPAEVVAMSVALWQALAAAKDTSGDFPLYPSLGPFNRSGTMNAVDANGQVIGVDWYVEPALGSGIKGVVGVRDAWLTMTSPLQTLAADNPSHLTRESAVFQFAAFGATDATGLIEIANATP